MPDYIAVFGADHVYRMDPGQMLAAHIASGAGATVAGIRVPRAEAKAFGCINSDATGRISEFLEKPSDPPSVPDDPEVAFASMGNYVFTTEAMLDALKADAEDGDSDHDMGGDIIPRMVNQGDAHVYDFAENVVPGATDRDAGYWRDVGTIDAYYEAHTDLVSVHPIFNLYNQRWPIRTAMAPLPPAKFVEGGIAQDSIVGAGTIISGAIVRRSVISPNVRIAAGAEVSDSVVMPGVHVGSGAVVRGRHPGQERARFPTAPSSASTSPPTVPATPSARAASWCSARASSPSRSPHAVREVQWHTSRTSSVDHRPGIRQSAPRSPASGAGSGRVLRGGGRPPARRAVARSGCGARLFRRPGAAAGA